MSVDGMDFSIRLTKAKQLKLALKALADTDFNPNGCARIDVLSDEELKTLTLNVYNSRNDIHGHLWLMSGLFPELEYFQHTADIGGKTVDIVAVHKIFDNQDDNNPVTIAHVCGSNELSFIFGCEEESEAMISTRRFSVEFLKNAPRIELFIPAIPFNGAALKTQDLQLIIHHSTVKPKLFPLIVSIEHGASKLQEYDNSQQTCRNTRSTVFFEWEYPQMLGTLASMEAMCNLYLLKTPHNKIKFVFTVLGLGVVGILCSTMGEPSSSGQLAIMSEPTSSSLEDEYVRVVANREALVKLQNLLKDGVYVDAIKYFITCNSINLNIFQRRWLKHRCSTSQQKYLAKLGCSIMGKSPPPMKTEELFNYSGGGDVDLQNFEEVLNFFMGVDFGKTWKDAFKYGVKKVKTFYRL